MQFKQEVNFGKFRYNLPVNNEDAKRCSYTSGCIGLNEAYEGTGFVMAHEFFEAAKLLHRQLPIVREMLKTNNFNKESIDFVIGELLETKDWLLRQKTQTL